MCKAEDDVFASDENILSISKRLIRQNKEAYEVLANQVNPRQDQVDIAKSLFGILPKGCRCRGIQSRKAEDMRVLIDTNIVIDVLTLWKPYKEHIEK